MIGDMDQRLRWHNGGCTRIQWPRLSCLTLAKINHVTRIVSCISLILGKLPKARRPIKVPGPGASTWKSEARSVFASSGTSSDSLLYTTRSCMRGAHDDAKCIPISLID